MQIEYLEEFTVLAHYLNMRRAAAKLDMPQSSLSKHVKQLEAEMGCALLLYRGDKMYLTEAGAFFLNQSQQILGHFRRVVDECQHLGDGALPAITVQTPSLSDAASNEYRRVIRHLTDMVPGLQVRYARVAHKSLVNSLRQGRLDLLLEYRCGAVESITDDYAARGLLGAFLCSDHLVAWCGKGHRLGGGGLMPGDLRDEPIMTPVGVSSPMRTATLDLCRAHGFEPFFASTDTSSQEEFLRSGLPSGIYLYPASFMDAPAIQAREDMVVSPFVEEVLVHAFAVTCPRDGLAARKLQELLEMW